MNALAMTNDSLKREICMRMAEAILEIIDLQGRCSIFDLNAMGFSIDETTSYWHEACELAEAMNHKACHRLN